MKNHKILFSFLILVLTASTNSAYAKGLFRLDLGYGSDSFDNGDGEDKLTRQYIDALGGYKFQDSGWALLGQYAMETLTQQSGESSSTDNRTSYGAGFGWITMEKTGAYVQALYYISSTYKTTSTTYTGSGYHAQFGLKARLDPITFIFGLAYEGFTYPKTSTGTLDSPRKETHLSPRFGLQFDF